MDNPDPDTSARDDVSEEPNFWRDVIISAYVKLGTTYAHPEDAAREPFLGELVDAVREVVDHHVAAAGFFEHKDKTYDAIQGSIEDYEEKGLSPEEANEAGWSERRFLIRDIIKRNLDIFAPTSNGISRTIQQNNRNNNFMGIPGLSAPYCRAAVGSSIFR